MTETAPKPPAPREPRVFFWTLAALVLAYLTLRLGMPRVAVWIGAADTPPPMPKFALTIYMLCALVGALVYVSSDDRRWASFLGPIRRLFLLAPGPGRPARLLILIAIPLAVGWLAWHRVKPNRSPPTVVRLQHPTEPREYGALASPLRALPEDARREATREGIALYHTNCRPCHGVVGAGDGPLARGLRLRPINFTDPGAIASVVESYPFWRIREGHAALPDIATPWNSAMPAWAEELSDEEIWKIILAEYFLSGTEPRVPEGGGR